MAANNYNLPANQSLNCCDNLPTLGLGEWLYFSHYTCLQTFFSGPGESLTSFHHSGILNTSSGPWALWNESSRSYTTGPWAFSYTIGPWAFSYTTGPWAFSYTTGPWAFWNESSRFYTTGPWAFWNESSRSYKFGLWAFLNESFSLYMLGPWTFLNESVTSSYVYIRLVLVTSLAEKIQRTIFYISVFPTVSKMYSKQRLLGYLDHLLTD